MKKGIIGGALLFASACGTPEISGGVAVDAAAVDAAAVDAAAADSASVDSGAADSGAADSGPADVTATDTGAKDVGPADGGPADSGPADSGPADSGPADVGPADVGPADASAVDAGVMDATAPDSGGGVPDSSQNDAVADDAKGDTTQPSKDIASDTGCYKPSAADAPQLLGTPCAQAFQAVCDDKGQVVIMCQGSKWTTWAGGGCKCFHTKCGPDQASCIAVGFVGISQAGRTRKVGRVVRLYA